MNVDTTPKRNWAYIFSPSVIVAIIFVMAGIYTQTPMERNEERAYVVYAIVFLLPCLIISLAIDLIARFCLKEVREKALYIWIIEVIMMVLVFGIFIVWYSL